MNLRPHRALCRTWKHEEAVAAARSDLVERLRLSGSDTSTSAVRRERSVEEHDEHLVCDHRHLPPSWQAFRFLFMGRLSTAAHKIALYFRFPEFYPSGSKMSKDEGRFAKCYKDVDICLGLCIDLASIHHFHFFNKAKPWRPTPWSRSVLADARRLQAALRLGFSGIGANARDSIWCQGQYCPRWHWRCSRVAAWL